MAKFFIERPIFAWVLALLILIGGALSLNSLPVTAYPSIAPPQVTVSATYPGASAQVVEETVTTVIEEEMSGIPGLMYVTSDSSRNGTASIVLTFETGTDIDIAGIEVQNRIKRVEAKLPSSVMSQGVAVDKTRPDFLMIVALYSPNGSKNVTDLAEYIDSRVLGEIRRLPGVGTAELFGAKYAMRIWLDPKRMAAFQITPAEVVQAVRTQNVQLASGELGGLPSVADQSINATVTVPAQLSTPEEFGQVILRSSGEGGLVRLRDVADIERGAENYMTRLMLNGSPATGFSTKLSTDGNALESARLIKAKMDELSQYFPEDVEWMSPYDTSLFVDVSIKEVLKTLGEAVILVTLVMFVFLQNWRTTLVPLVVVPLSLIGTGLGLYAFDFSINMLTLFGMVLVIGIVVDDAIIVVENVERLMSDEGLGPFEATKKAMRQISGAIIGTTAVLISVFVPMVFFSGSVGEIYKQFALTIAIAVTLSAFFALTLTPAMTQGFLKAKSGEAPRGFFGWFERGLKRFTTRYMGWINSLVTKVGIAITVLVFALITVFDVVQYQGLPKGFVPAEDQGFIVAGSLLPAGATRDRTEALAKKTDAFLAEQPEIKDVLTVLGFGFLGMGQNTSITFANLHPWEQRIAKGQRDAESLIADVSKGLPQFMADGLIFAFNMPPIPGLGNDNGFDFRLQDRANLGEAALNGAMYQLLGAAAQHPDIVGVRPNSLPAAPQLRLDVDRVKARAYDIDLDALNTAIQIALGSAYVNDYIENGSAHQVWVQANAETRSTVESILEIQVRNKQGGLVRLSEVVTASWTQGPAKLGRFNGYSAIPIMGGPAPGKSSGDAMAAMESIAATLPPGISFEWAGQSLEEKSSSGQAPLLFGLSLLVAFLVLAALYESWSIPVAVILVVPIGILGSLLAIKSAGMINDVYFTVGFITIVGLSAKNAIMIVEFARDAELEGKT
ncbi:MAG: efflux RND transporter permease subunit, partial [Granulosicoccaceae bacterium]